MDHADLIALLRGGIDSKGGIWADLGAGDGAFTAALADLLGPGARITAVDKDAGSLRRLRDEMGRRFPATRLETLVADFTRQLGLAGLDGIVMANSLHFVRNKAPVLESVRGMLHPGGALVVVEYGADRGNPWVPHPFSFTTWERLAAEGGFERTRRLETIPSRFLNNLYSAVTYRPLAS